ncbi:recombinase family protein [Candidatus Peregrinibacteria bacterium]|jgi:site-specific DNA recombinase|nr:recombinase family protein [Candidatus Peregrinibacteria bacterium]MBT4055599.1 recombinase family protein [Candidatus Peregrinibacteria bacterium]
MKYFIYCRKSTEEKDRQLLSIESQRDELRTRFPEIEIVGRYEESKSAFKPYNRPMFNEMLERIKNGEADGIAAWDPSRLSRNPLDGSMIIHLLDTGVIKDLKFGSYHFDNSPEGKMMLNFALSQSKYSSDKLSKDVKRGMLKKCSKGSRPNMAPTGYMNDYNSLKGEKQILEDPERFELVRKMWEMLLSSRYSVRDIWRISNEEWRFKTRKFKTLGGKPLAINTLYRIFTNSFYYGEFIWDGETYQGSHTAMITKEEFDRAQILLGRKGRPRPQKHRFPYTGVIKCGECGCSVTAEHKLKKLVRSGETKIYTYYHCTKKKYHAKCSQKHITADDLESQIVKVLETITVPENLFKCTVKYLEKLHNRESKDRTNIQKNIQNSYNDCGKRIDNLLKLYICPENADKSLLDEHEFKEQKQRLLKEKEQIAEKLEDCDRRQKDWLDLSEKTFEFATYAKHWFETGTLDDKKSVFQSLGQNFLLKDGELDIELPKQFISIKNGLKSLRTQNPRFSLVSEDEITSKDFEKGGKLFYWSG